MRKRLGIALKEMKGGKKKGWDRIAVQFLTVEEKDWGSSYERSLRDADGLEKCVYYTHVQ